MKESQNTPIKVPFEARSIAVLAKCETLVLVRTKLRKIVKTLVDLA